MTFASTSAISAQAFGATTPFGSFSVRPNRHASNHQSLLRESAKGISMPTDSSKRAGNFSSSDTKPRAFHLTQSEWRSLSRTAFREHTKGMHKPSHMLADELECSPKTAQSWLDGESTPAGILDLRAMSRVPAYAALKREIAAMESGLDPRLQAKYQELHRLTLELAGRGNLS